MKTMEIGMRMIVQGAGTITIPEGGAPVFQLLDPPRNHVTIPEIAQAVNFLRCGCRFVQIKLSDDTNQDSWKVHQEVIQEKFRALQIPDEEFIFSLDHEFFFIIVGMAKQS